MILKTVAPLALMVAMATALEPCDMPDTPTPTPTPVPLECIVTGCSGQVCAPEPVMTTCEWTCEYGCYQYAICEVQPTGTCGWTRTDPFEECIADCSQTTPILAD